MQHAVLDAARQVWPPFVLVAGLLAIGTVVEADGLFAAVGTRIELIGGSTFRLFAALLALEAVVAALLNLDTAVVFLTPILLHAARQRGCDERPFLYGALFIANAASILLPGSNLTNLIVLAHEHLSGAEVAKAMALPWVASVALTIVLLALWYRPHAEEGARVPLPPLRLRTGALATIIASGFILAFENPALPVLVVSIVAVTVRRLRPPRQQPSRRVAPGSAAATSSTPAPARPEPRPEPCRQRFIGGIPLVPLGPRFRCPPFGCAGVTPRADRCSAHPRDSACRPFPHESCGLVLVRSTWASVPE